MAMGTERSKALHNFTMPCGLRWGNHRILRCMRVNSDAQTSPLRRHAAGSDHHPIQQRRTTRERNQDDFLNESPKTCGRRFSEDADNGIAATREKVMLDLQTAADKMKDAIFKDGLEEGEVSAAASLPQPSPPPPAEAEGSCPWNLRTRRAACRTSGDSAAVGGGKSFRIDLPRPAGSSQIRSGQKSPMRKSEDGGAAAASGKKREREKFSGALSKRDVEEDFYAMVGHRPPRRPKKRPRIVQKQLDTLFPGLWLTEVTTDMYKVIEAAPH
ncbi:hypothetical protein SASPL_130828 [Salvia splendens]|uniref:DUF1639 family protein n=1 Tax=Salvia splendens TaxID=180675 RepID=A0A8X8X838_SALSN|nr:uncharacterized protein LOC121753622 [Salvia splendens]XP_042004777.1 uncharacterized protein LOC121753622 [Salvia splendens]XP_042004779.1 uncharacterized protein LOC121753622 [Salvia splendens]KAG6407829.1 hypothetical protein SASPL_130828 [Salvia splendens]